MRILGIDPGLATLGYGIIDSKKSSASLAPVTYGVISTSKDMEIGERLDHIQKQLRVLLRLYNPHVVCAESIFFFRNQKTVIQIGQVQGIISLTFHKARKPLHRYAPLQVKNTLTGNGKAQKKEVEEHVRRVLNIKEKIRPDDTADALAVALCHVLKK
jgi:crossover junction endodeoxyribonuclease RuvC